ncbi:hypothetical protein [Roseospira goensis]|uniref:Glycosyl transferase n=1 Tax=Roseospira goensis TaxID=391922 RepID=A0A7W6RWS1_9PROT|nr:hypothetical protein [Roseospira goensis]MBB4284663.1 hypothetical protein [Roseospira goensis]
MSDRTAVASPRITIVTGADDRYAPLAAELIASVRAHRVLDHIDLSLIGTGMSPAVAESLRPQVENFADGTWSIDAAERRAAGRDWLMARVAKLYTRDFFPGYDVYIWIDADAWVCDPAAIDWLLTGVAEAGLAVGYDDRPTSPIPLDIRGFLGGWVLARTYCMKHARRARLPAEAVRRLARVRPFNNGVFALAADAPHWPVIQGHMRRLVHKGRIVGSNQMAIVMAVHLDGLPVAILPHACNYLEVPRVCARSGAFVEAEIPHRPVGVLHLAARDAMRADPTLEMDLRDTAGGTVRRSLRYRSEYLARA